MKIVEPGPLAQLIWDDFVALRLMVAYAGVETARETTLEMGTMFLESSHADEQPLFVVQFTMMHTQPGASASASYALASRPLSPTQVEVFAAPDVQERIARDYALYLGWNHGRRFLTAQAGFVNKSIDISDEPVNVSWSDWN